MKNVSLIQGRKGQEIIKLIGGARLSLFDIDYRCKQPTSEDLRSHLHH
jgi:hypothetical protein